MSQETSQTHTDNIMGTPLITVYLVNHNYSEFIAQAIESVLAQTEKNFELLIIDDGSTDDSREIIERYDDNPKVTVIYQKNKGLNVTNNIAFRASKGKYVMRLDADDYLDENALSVMSGVLERNPSVGLVFPDYYQVDRSGNILDIVRRHDFNDVTVYDQPAHGACTMIRRDSLKKIDGYDEAFRCQDGWDLWVRFIEHFEVRNVNLPLFYYRQHGSNLTRDEERLLTTRAEILKKKAAKVAEEAMLDCIAVIPVRGAVADPHCPAMRSLGGKKLIDWTIEAAINAATVSQIIVSTPDPEILAHVEKVYGDEVLTIPRDRKLAMLNTSLNETLTDIFNQLPEDRRFFNAVMMLFVECPFRDAKHIDMAADAMKVFGTDEVIGVRPELDRFYQHNGEGLKPISNNGQESLLRLESEEIFREVGALHLIRRGHFTFEEDKEVSKVGHIILEPSAAMYLGSKWDWEVANLIAEKMVSEEIRNQNKMTGGD